MRYSRVYGADCDYCASTARHEAHGADVCKLNIVRRIWNVHKQILQSNVVGNICVCLCCDMKTDAIDFKGQNFVAASFETRVFYGIANLQ